MERNRPLAALIDAATFRPFASRPEKAYDAAPAGKPANIGRVVMSGQEPEDFSTSSTFSRRTQLTMILATALVCGAALAAMLVE
jgi:hypothetical protein